MIKVCLQTTMCVFADKHLPKQSFASLPKRKKVDSLMSEHILSDLSSNDKNHAKRPTTKDKVGKKLSSTNNKEHDKHSPTNKKSGNKQSSTNNIDRAERLSTKSKESENRRSTDVKAEVLSISYHVSTTPIQYQIIFVSLEINFTKLVRHIFDY